MQTLCLDKLQYILMQQMPAQLRDVFLGVGSHSENIWFSDQKQPLKHLPWASFHHKLKYFIQKLERAGGLIIQSFAMSDTPQARASWARALSHKGRSLIHSLPSQTTSTPIFLPRHFSDNTGKGSWGRTAWRTVSEQTLGSLSASKRHSLGPCALEAPAATGSILRSPKPPTLLKPSCQEEFQNSVVLGEPAPSFYSIFLWAFPKAEPFLPK